MKTKHEIYMFMRKEIKSKQIAPALFKPVLDVLNKAIETRMPQLIGGDPGVGKTYGCQYFAYKNGYDISIINASDDLRKKSGEILVRSELLKPSSKTKLLILDEVEKESNLKYLTKMVEVAKKSVFQTNVILICISNNPWKLGNFKKAFGPFYTQITAPFVRSIGKALREMKIEYKGGIIRDLRFFRNIVRNPQSSKIPAIPDNTFDAIKKFLGAEYIDRNIEQTKMDLNAPFWRWLVLNFHHGKFNYIITLADGKKRTSYPKHNTAMYFNMVNGLSRASQYNSDDLLEFVLPQLSDTRLTHPSSLNKRKFS